MNNILEYITQQKKYKLNIQTDLSDDWIIKNLSSKPYLESIKLNSVINLLQKDILTIIGTLTDTTNGPNILIINGEYGFINDTFYDKTEYNINRSIIENRLNVLNIKKKNLVVGNLYERPDGSSFIYLGIKYIINKKSVINKKELIKKDYYSNLKTKYYILNITTCFVDIEEVNNKNITIFQDLGNNGLLTDIELNNKLESTLQADINIFKFYTNKDINFIGISFKEEEYNPVRVEELKKSKQLIVYADGAYYKFLQHKKYHTEEKVSGRPLQKTYYKYDLYQKISITDNQLITLPILKHDFLETNSWYGNSYYTFEDSFTLRNKQYYKNSNTFSKIENKIFTINYEEI